MSIRSRLRLLILCCLVISWCGIFAQPPPSPKKRLSDLQARYERRSLGDTAYLNAVDSIVPLLLKDERLEQLLSIYQRVAFDNKGLGKYRKKYYQYLALYSINTDKYGSAIYYSEKNNEEGIKIGLFEKDGLSHGDMFAIAVYDLNKDYPRMFSKYNILRPALLKLPAAIPSGKISAGQAYVALGILQMIVEASDKTGDTARAKEGVLICEKMREGIRNLPGKYYPDTTLYNCIYHSICYDREKYLNHLGRAGDLLEMAIGEVRSRGFSSYLRASYTYDLYTEAFDFYFNQDKRDSAQHYLDLVQAISDSLLEYPGIRQSFLLEGGSRLLASGGRYEAAYGDLRRAYAMRDSSFYAVSADKDNNLYALTKAEDTGNELLRTEAKKREAERFNAFLFLLLALLILGGVTIFGVYRSKQRQRLLNLRLNVARNFHDEIGPLLLYAGTLVKKEGKTNPSPGLEELKGQIAHIMEGVRSISHDLKSNELSTVGSFCKEVTGLLEKIKATTRIDFKVRVGNGNRVLSHYQYTHLKKIVNELISNSIKHAGCDFIDIYVQVTDRNVVIHYSDDGKGMQPERSTGGIGLQNMQERAHLLNGTFQLHNAYPEGYSIDISIPLV